jgi:GT2 family glycosyltransferase
MTDPTLLTIVLNYRTPEMTLKAVEAALREMAGIAGEVVIVDNDSQDDSFEMLTQAATDKGWIASGRVRVLQSGRNGGFGAGNNVGMRAGLSDGREPDYFYILNSDAWPEPGAIRYLLDHMQAHAKTGIAGSFLRGSDDEPHISAFRFPSIAGELEESARLGVITRLFPNAIVAMPIPTKVTQVGWVAGASMILRRRMLDEIGMFDETFFLYYEETDLCLRAARAGWRTEYVPHSEVIHVGSVSTGMKTWRRTPHYWFDSRQYYFVKNHGTGYAVLATLARITGTLISRLRRMIGSKPQVEPDGFLRDLTAHFVKSMIRSRSVRPTPAPLVRPFAEDNK